MKRLYTVVKTRKPDGLVDMHNFQFPGVAWGTGIWQGEGLAVVHKKDKTTSSPLDVLPMPLFKAKYMGHPIGLPAEFLYMSNRPFTFVQATGYTLLHDMPVRPTSGGELAFNSKLFRLFDAFGRKEAEWLPYWRNAAYVTATPPGADDKPGVYVSLYRHKQNGVVAVILNLSRRKEEPSVRFDLKRLGLAGRELTARDALSETDVRLDSDTVRLPNMAPMEWHLIWLKHKE